MTKWFKTSEKPLPNTKRLLIGILTHEGSNHYGIIIGTRYDTRLVEDAIINRYTGRWMKPDLWCYAPKELING